MNSVLFPGIGVSQDNKTKYIQNSSHHLPILTLLFCLPLKRYYYNNSSDSMNMWLVASPFFIHQSTTKICGYQFITISWAHSYLCIPSGIPFFSNLRNSSCGKTSLAEPTEFLSSNPCFALKPGYYVAKYITWSNCSLV